MSSSTIGLFTGLVLGIAWEPGQFDAFVSTAVRPAAWPAIGQYVLTTEGAAVQRLKNSSYKAELSDRA